MPFYEPMQDGAGRWQLELSSTANIIFAKAGRDMTMYLCAGKAGVGRGDLALTAVG